MFSKPEAMTVTPVSRNPSPETNVSSQVGQKDDTPILALKKLVANLQKEQHKIQDLLSSLGFALRSFSNLNQFLELTPLMAARVTDAEGGALILFKDDSQVYLEQIHCHDSQIGAEVRQVLERVNHHLHRQNSRGGRTQGRVGEQAMSGESNSPKNRTPGFESWKAPPIRDVHDEVSGLINQSSQLVTDLLDDKIKQQLEPKIQIFGTPVLVRNIEQGRLYIFSSDPEYIWTPTRRKLAQLIADQTAVAIANHELTVELRSKERQDRELEIASEIQLRLLPSKCPQIQGLEISAKCQTANRVGGDYYDFIPTNYDQIRQNNRDCQDDDASTVPWSIVIGDVMGKGVPAGLIMTMTRGMLRAEVLNRHSPAKIMQHLNRVMYADLENSHRFVSMFYSEYDPKTQTLSFTNAAHNPPLWWQAATGKIKKLDTWGMLIGLDIDSEYEEDRVQLAPGDTIIYYTDGFTDAVNANGDRFEEENLYRAFQWACQNFESSQEILDYFFHRVEDFTGRSSNNTDDMTLIVMRIQAEK
jgi:sigma-B regulation protein RsbU (phosphoserine phosphatase)